MIKELNDIFEEILQFAERNQKCLRKAVGCAAIGFHINDVATMQDKDKKILLDPFIVVMQHNGPSRSDHECTNEVSNCGCSHSEPRVVQSMLGQQEMMNAGLKPILICTYSPCTTCANIIIDSGLFCGCIYDILTLHDKRGEQFLKEVMPILTKEELNKLTEKEASDRIKEWISS